MSRYYCPFCSSSYQIYQTKSDGLLICGQCGEPLMKRPLINLRQIFGLLAASAFLAPLLIMIIFVIKDFTKEGLPNNSEAFVSLNFN
tara:strand:- start:68 stop:328 length:261 start_codon:yes stop_codon:yes gene_type:complete